MYDYKAYSSFFKQSSLEKLTAIKDTALREGHDLWVDGTPVPYAEFKEWILTLKKELPDFQFIPARAEYANVSYRTVVSFEIGMEGVPYTLGHIAIKKEWGKDIEFIVRSPNVYNARGKGQDEYRTCTRKMATAIKNVKKYILPLRTGEIVKLTYEKIWEKVSHTRDIVDREWDRLQFDLRNNSLTLSEALMSSAKTGTLTNYLLEMANSLQVVYDRRNAVYANKPSFYAVHVYKNNVSVTELTPRLEDWTKYDTGEINYYEVSELPTEVAEGIAVLSVLNVGDGLEGVGYRPFENIFYIQRK